MNHGMSRKDAEDYCRQQNELARFLKQNAGKAALTKMTGLMISYDLITQFSLRTTI